METPSVSVSKAFCREQLHVLDKICELLHTKEQSKDRKTDNVRDQLSEIPDVPERVAPTEGMEMRKYSPEHSRAVLLSVKQTGFM